MKVLPIGTSRLHEPMSLVDAPGREVLFPGFGYFHTAQQIQQLLEVLGRDRNLAASTAQYFFRRDQVPGNPFDGRLFTGDLGGAIGNMRAKFDAADVLLVEVCSQQNFFHRGVYLQGNPNAKKNVPYADVWREGYYKDHAPEMDVSVFTTSPQETRNGLAAVAGLAERHSKGLVLLSHLADGTERTRARNELRETMLRFAAEPGRPHVRFYDQLHLVEEHGFRVLDDGTMDIHHLPWDALHTQVDEMLALAATLVPAHR